MEEEKKCSMPGESKPPPFWRDLCDKMPAVEESVQNLSASNGAPINQEDRIQVSSLIVIEAKEVKRGLFKINSWTCHCCCIWLAAALSPATKAQLIQQFIGFNIEEEKSNYPV